MQELNAAPRDELTEQQVIDSLSWVHSTLIRWGVDTLDTLTLAATGIDLEVDSGGVSWQWRAQPNEGGSPVAAQVRRRGTLRYRHIAEFNPLAVLYRLWVEMRSPVGVKLNDNWHFEDDLAEWQGSSGGVTRERSADVAHTHSWSYKITPNGVDGTAEGSTVHDSPVLFAVVEGDTYTADCWSYAPTGYDETRVVLSFRDDSDTEIGSAVSDTVTSPAGEWTNHVTSGVAPVDATQVRLFVQATGTPTGSDVVYWDDCKILAGSPSAWVRWHLGVFVATLPPYEYQGLSDHDGAVVWRPLDLADRSHIWQSHETEDPVMVETDTDIVLWVQDDLAARFKELDTSGVVGGAVTKTATEDYVFDAGTPWLQIYSTVLGAIGNEPLHADADGFPRSRPLDDPELREAEHLYSFGTTVLAPVTVEAVNPDLPNVLRFIARRSPSLAEEGNGIRTITNDNTGPGSVTQRGRQVLHRVEVDAQDQDDLDAQARALAPFYFAGGGLRAIQEVGLNPRHDDSDVVFLEKPALAISGNWLVTGWDIQLGDIDTMRTMRLEVEQLTGAAFVPLQPADVGSFGTMMFGVLPFGASTVDAAVDVAATFGPRVTVGVAGAEPNPDMTGYTTVRLAAGTHADLDVDAGTFVLPEIGAEGSVTLTGQVSMGAGSVLYGVELDAGAGVSQWSIRIQADDCAVRYCEFIGDPSTEHIRAEKVGVEVSACTFAGSPANHHIKVDGRSALTGGGIVWDNSFGGTPGEDHIQLEGQTATVVAHNAFTGASTEDFIDIKPGDVVEVYGHDFVDVGHGGEALLAQNDGVATNIHHNRFDGVFVSYGANLVDATGEFHDNIVEGAATLRIRRSGVTADPVDIYDNDLDGATIRLGTSTGDDYPRDTAVHDNTFNDLTIEVGNASATTVTAGNTYTGTTTGTFPGPDGGND